ncbi:hypothetical protein [Rhizomicrobium electricum]|uniref:Uncharacterized protein n=1 Tax=Rhizomicrobium electricum TaxID=480070 RepID=A0ABP3Q4C9_9PROT|nr:hypothetical protein [Rhizomicrobium electricum]NIJ50523.1 hypothetical protein [Rhizomicrobium electricum]
MLTALAPVRAREFPEAGLPCFCREWPEGYVITLMLRGRTNIITATYGAENRQIRFLDAEIAPSFSFVKRVWA